MGRHSSSSCTHAWVQPSVSRHRTPHVATLTTRSFPALHSTVSPETEQQQQEDSSQSPSATNSPRTVADGVVVAQYPGGFTAIKLNEEDLLVNISPGSRSAIFDPSSQAVGVAKNNINKNNNVVATGDLQGKRVVFPDQSTGVVVAHRPPVVFVHSTTSAEVEGRVRILDTMASVKVSPSAKSGLIDPLNVEEDIIDENNNNKNSNDQTLSRAIFAPIPQVKDIALINSPMLSGITMVDTLAPVGRGQNMLLVGHDLDDMRGYALDFVQTQLRDNPTNTKCIYATTTQDSYDSLLKRLQDADISPERDIHVVAHDSNDQTKKEDHETSQAARAVAIAGAACAVGEIYALEKGMDALVVIDTIDLHKRLWDATTNVLVDVFGVDAVVKGDREGGASSEMRAFYSSLIQRSAQYKQKRGGGSVTLLLLTTVPLEETDEETVFEESIFDQSPDKIKDRIKLLTKRNIPLTAANLRKIDIPVPTEGKRRLVLQHVDDLISMSDGQIWLDDRLETAGQRPPMDPQRSVTRIGIGADTNSRADAPALRRIAERLRLDLSQASSMEGAEDTAASKKQLRLKQALLLAMHQASGTGGRRLSESCVALLAAFEGHLDKAVDDGALAGTDQGDELMKRLLDHVLQTAATTMAEIDTSLDLSQESRTELSNAIASFFES